MEAHEREELSRWEVIPERSNDYLCEARGEIGETLHDSGVVSKYAWYEAGVKWDGCVHFNRAFNTPFSDADGHSWDDKHGDDVDYIHICDIDHMIALLQQLKATATKYFHEHGREWPG